MNFIKNIINADERHLSKINKLAKKIDSLSEEMRNASDDALRKIVNEVRGNLIINAQASEQDIVNVFAVVREVDYRVLNQYPYYVQLVGGLVLYYGDIAEMKTGEGKTLTSTMPIVLRALEHRGVHVVTTNEYLSSRDYESLKGVYEFLGLSVGLNQNGVPRPIKQRIFNSEIVYTTNSELGFDYLRDGFIKDKRERVINQTYYAIIDEVDSILIDEARTPLIIAGQGREDVAYYQKAQTFVASLKSSDVSIDEETRSVYLEECGIKKAESFYQVENMYLPQNMALVHSINQALKANYIFKKDIDYVSINNEIMIVDKYTGRILEGREYSDGLHQAIQAKEKVEIKSENKTQATITYQNYFRLYNILAGMSGTTKSEEIELFDTYNMRSFPIPTNKPLIRIDDTDKVFETKRAKVNAIVQDTIDCLNKKQPVLIGTGNIEDSVLLAQEFKKQRIPFELLNGTQDKNEAQIISRAGNMGVLTIATNIAGRGTDIPLQAGVNEIGGLCVFGFERFDARRIDNQLKGRCGRQGDRGLSRMYVSLDDSLFVEHANELQKAKLHKKKGKDLMALIDLIQRQAEANHYNARKQMLKYEDEMRLQREVIMELREAVLNNQTQMISDQALSVALKALIREHDIDMNTENEVNKAITIINEVITPNTITSNLYDLKNAEERYMQIVKDLNSILDSKYTFDTFDNLKKSIILNTLDNAWMEHVDMMMQLKTGIHLRAKGGQDPAMVFKEEAYKLFETMMAEVYLEIGNILLEYLNDKEKSDALFLCYF